MRNREIETMIQAVPTADGAGVKLSRTLGSRRDLRLDPFLLLDEFSSDNASDYIAGFPAHPHRGFETLTYMLDGHMRHEDHMGNRGDLKPGDVQWMRAGRGIIHSEMPQQTAGRMRGFQLWVNLPAAEKMQPAQYRDIPAAQIPQLDLEGGGLVKVIAGAFEQNGQTRYGPINGTENPLTTDLQYLDIQLPAGADLRVPVDAQLNALLFVFEGAVQLQGQDVPLHNAAILGPGNGVAIQTGAQPARLLLLAGKPLNEPVAQYGPFVMNTTDEVEQAIRDYQAGTLTQA
ncbi:MAG: pirin family protein [Nevskiales bacterium]